MKQKNKFSFCIFIILGTLLLLTIDCKKDNKKNDSTETKTTTPIPTNTVTDIDGNVYHTVTIGTQVWMIENLKTTKYRNGDNIPNVTNDTLWHNLTTGAYCNYNNNAINSATYGRLYNWYAVNDSRNIAPEGWHIPSDAEWTVLSTYLGGDSIAGGKLKEAGTTHWFSPNTGATNSSGFTALPCGCRDFYDGAYAYIGSNSYWWSSTTKTSNSSTYLMIQYQWKILIHNNFSKNYGFSVRCIKN